MRRYRGILSEQVMRIGIRRLNGWSLGLVWLSGVLVIGFVVGQFNLPKLWRLSRRAQRTEGIIISIEPRDHRIVNYEYSADGHTFRSSAQIGAGNPPFQLLHPRQRIVVYYDVDKPGVSLPGDPRRRLANEFAFIAFAALIVPTSVVIGLVTRAKQQAHGA
jgi:hypothetical protein